MKDVTGASSTPFPRGPSQAGCASRFTVRHCNRRWAVVSLRTRLFPLGKSLSLSLLVAQSMRERWLGFLPGSASLDGFTSDGEVPLNTSIFFPFKPTKQLVYALQLPQSSLGSMPGWQLLSPQPPKLSDHQPHCSVRATRGLFPFCFLCRYRHQLASRRELNLMPGVLGKKDRRPWFIGE